MFLLHQKGILGSIGNTPLIELFQKDRKGAKILLKLEGNNPGGSVKDRTALWMVRSAEKSGELTKGKTILEATSGNTGIGLALVGAASGYKVKLILPETASLERKRTLEAYGAELILSSGKSGIDGAVQLADQISDLSPNMYWRPDQYSNEANWRSHYESTSIELLHQTEGKIDAFVAGMGTGGTLMGVARRMNEQSNRIAIIGVEPERGHSIQGLKNMTESKRPAIYKEELLDDVKSVTDSSAFAMVRFLARTQGVFTGMSGGAAVDVALKVANKMPSEQTVVTLLPDRGDRYLSTGIFNM